MFQAYVDKREGKFAVYVVNGNDMITHSGQLLTEADAIKVVKNQAKAVLARAEHDLKAAQQVIDRWSGVADALDRPLIPRD